MNDTITITRADLEHARRETEDIFQGETFARCGWGIWPIESADYCGLYEDVRLADGAHACGGVVAVGTLDELRAGVAACMPEENVNIYENT